MFFFPKGNIREARCILSRTIHQHPSSAPLWRALAQHLLTHLPSSREAQSVNIIATATAAAACASAAAKLTQAAGLDKTITQVFLFRFSFSGLYSLIVSAGN